MITKEEEKFILEHRDKILAIMEKYIRGAETTIRKEPDVNKKVELSAVVNVIEDWQIYVKNLKYSEPTKGSYTGI